MRRYSNIIPVYKAKCTYNEELWRIRRVLSGQDPVVAGDPRLTGLNPHTEANHLLEIPFVPPDWKRMRKNTARERPRAKAHIC